MDDQKLDEYIKNMTDRLKTANYSNDDIKEAIDKITINKTNERTFLTLFTIYSLILGIIISFAIIVLSTFFPGDLWFYFVLVLVLGSLGYLLYFEFKYLDFKTRTIFYITSLISILVSVCAGIIHFLISQQINIMRIQQQAISSSSVGSLGSMFGMPINIFVLIALILITYNLLPIIFLIERK